MDSRKYLLTQTGIVLLGTGVCSGAMVGIFALLGRYDTAVALGALVGTLAATANFFVMALVATLASQKAVAQNVKGGQALIQGSYPLRMAVLFLVLFAFAKSGLCNAIALVLPLVFVRPVLTLVEFFRKPGDASL